MIIITIIFIIIGWLTGVAINHAADILPTRKTLLQKPTCKVCGSPYAHRQWSALVAWLSGSQNCTQCGSPRERFTRAVIIEFTLPLVFALLLWRYELSAYLGLILLYTAILVLITVTDLEHRLIFHVVTIPSIVFAIAVAFATPYLSWRAALLGGALAFVLVYIVWLLGTVVYGHGALGVGDITLATFLGLILGFPNIILSLIFGVFLGGFVAFVLLITRRINRSSFIPYGPFLTITGWIMLIWGDEIWRYYFY